MTPDKAMAVVAEKVAAKSAVTLYKFSAYGPCLNYGVVVGESPMFWTVIDPRDGAKAKVKRWKKSTMYHTDACSRCPGSEYHRGWAD